MSAQSSSPGMLPFTAAMGLAASVAVTYLTLSNPLYGFALAYITLFFMVAWKHPHVVLMLIFASAPFQNDISGGGLVRFSIAEINLMLAFVVLVLQNVLRKRSFSIGPLFVPVSLYLGVSLLSSWQNWLGSVALISLVQMFLYLVVAVMVFSMFVPKPEKFFLSLYGLVGVGVFLACVALATGSNYILGLHKNGLGASLGCTLIVCLELWSAAREREQKRLLAAAMVVVAAALIFTLSRGAWLGAFAGTCMILALRRQFILLLRTSAVLVPFIALIWFLLPQESREYATDFSPSRYNIQMRYESTAIAKKHFESNPVYGAGVGLRKQYDASNVFLLTLAETGVLGLAALLFIHIVFFVMIWRTQKRLARTDKLYSLIAISGALVLNKLAHGAVDHYWSRGALMMAWTSAGTAVSVYYLVQRRSKAARESVRIAKS